MHVNYSSILAATLLLICSGCFQSDAQENVKSENNVRLTDEKSHTPSVDPEMARRTEFTAVYRHHPALIPDLEDRNFDHELILAVLEKSSGGSISIHGGMGHHGYTHEMPVEHIPDWINGMNELFASGKLRHYKDFGVDKNGIGLVKPENLPTK